MRVSSVMRICDCTYIQSALRELDLRTRYARARVGAGRRLSSKVCGEEVLAPREQSPSGNKPMRALQNSRITDLLESLVLTERLGTARMDRISQKLQPGTNSKEALQLLADRSAFFDPPADEMPNLAEPDAETQKQLIATAGSNVLKNLKRLPNFFATRTTVRYSGVAPDMNQKPHGDAGPGVFKEGQAQEGKSRSRTDGEEAH